MSPPPPPTSHTTAAPAAPLGSVSAAAAGATAPSSPLHVAHASHTGAVALLLNVAHALDHLMLLVFATAVGAIAVDFGISRWEDLMPFATGAFVLFGLGSLPAGRLGDHWGRRAMMLVFFFGLGASSILVALTHSPWQLAVALTLLGAFAAIYHPVGIPMLVQSAERPGRVIGVNGLAGNLGIAAAALSTGFLVKYFGWRSAFVVPGLVSIACGVAFARIAPRESAPPAKRAPGQVDLPAAVLARVFIVLTLTSTFGSLVFNFTTNGNGELLRERLAAVTRDPATLGMLLALVYAIGSIAQVVVGRLIDRVPLKPLFLAIVAAQVPLFALAVHAEGWALYVLAISFMVFVFGAIPFTDALIVRYVDDRMRSRVAGMRLAIAFGISALSVWLLGPVVKANGFGFLLALLAGIALCSTLAILALPRKLPDKARVG
ncbi:MAG: MFS transporter [Betaproteobacteria bacterium PRO3]|nr:MFS transporter [Betaproteobacteria bacterium PRO3]